MNIWDETPEADEERDRLLDAAAIKYPELDGTALSDQMQADERERMDTTVTLTCDMEKDCKAPVTYIDIKGYVYCAAHGVQRQSYQRCRKLRPAELKRLQAGGTVSKY
jgi:hypothetical protein